MEKEELYKLLAPIKPKQVFDQSLHPARPDYSVTYNWAALPYICLLYTSDAADE